MALADNSLRNFAVHGCQNSFGWYRAPDTPMRRSSRKSQYQSRVTTFFEAALR